MPTKSGYYPGHHPPDQSIIEPVWDYLEHQIRSRRVLPQNLEELWVALQEEWASIPLTYIRHLYESIPRRIKALGIAKGHYTKY